MDSIRVGDFCCRDDVRYVEVRIAARRRTNANGFISKSHMETFFVGRGIHSHRFDAHLVCSPDNPEGDFTAVSDKNFFKHDNWFWLDGRAT